MAYIVELKFSYLATSKFGALIMYELLTVITIKAFIQKFTKSEDYVRAKVSVSSFNRIAVYQDATSRFNISSIRLHKNNIILVASPKLYNSQVFKLFNFYVI